MVADLCFRGVVDGSTARHAYRLGYRVVASGKVDSVRDLENVRVVPRYEISRDAVDRYRSARGLKVLVVSSREDLKFYPKLSGSVSGIRIDFTQLTGVDKDFMRRVIGSRIPVEVEFAEVLRRVLSGEPIDYYYLLLRLYVRGKVEVYVCSGASDISSMVHPTAMRALISVLGVPEDLAAKAVLKVPRELVSGIA
ncbi:MAG: hypothetical protein RMH84_02200 [Sulfolobales archaeon]|nr:hypothetical protein [Sulfolobales archaeon]MCX8209110.1 hypothetical protein [Sulfolobales archaeon]MDW8010390.1 hypothetical protein [Sulfolobales archaeon]